MGSTTIPCTYMPSEGFTQQTLSWSVERDYSTSTILRRDDSGDHILLSRFRDRVSVPKHSPGNVSLLIENLEIPDSGHYTCQVIWRSKNNSLITKEVTTTVKVVKVAVTKPVIVAGERGLTVPAGARTSLSCVASGSPPISYRWFRSSPGGKARLLGHQAELVWDSAQPSDSGTYHCEAQGRAGAARQSDAVQLTVTGPPVPQQPSPGPGGHSRAPLTPQGDVVQSVPTVRKGSNQVSQSRASAGWPVLAVDSTPNESLACPTRAFPRAERAAGRSLPAAHRVSASKGPKPRRRLSPARAVRLPPRAAPPPSGKSVSRRCRARGLRALPAPLSQRCPLRPQVPLGPCRPCPRWRPCWVEPLSWRWRPRCGAAGGTRRNLSMKLLSIALQTSRDWRLMWKPLLSAYTRRQILRLKHPMTLST
ncbi:basement membrane-specific heparan sulfate proteoglycan core protein-like isoform X3 [Columba livia]